MHIARIVCPEAIEDKLAVKHHVTVREVRHKYCCQTHVSGLLRRVIPRATMYVYAAFGQTFGGRHLAVFFVYKPDTATAIIISARDMSDKERRAYGRK